MRNLFRRLFGPRKYLPVIDISPISEELNRYYVVRYWDRDGLEQVPIDLLEFVIDEEGLWRDQIAIWLAQVLGESKTTLKFHINEVAVE